MARAEARGCMLIDLILGGWKMEPSGTEEKGNKKTIEREGREGSERGRKRKRK